MKPSMLPTSSVSFFLAIVIVLGPYLPAPSDFEPHPTTDIHSEMERKLRM
jgi:hypothetical protein